MYSLAFVKLCIWKTLSTFTSTLIVNLSLNRWILSFKIRELDFGLDIIFFLMVGQTWISIR